MFWNFQNLSYIYNYNTGTGIRTETVMEKIKYLPKKDRPQDYLVWTCPNCKKEKFSTSPHRGAKLGVSVYQCGCGGLAPYKINSKYI